MSSLHLRGVQMMPKKIKPQKYLEIRKGKNNLRNPHILRILPFLIYLKFKKKFGSSYDLDIV